MRNINTVINEYYERFESYGNVVSIKSIKCWAFFLSAISSLFLAMMAIGLQDVPWLPQNQIIKLAIFFASFIISTLIWVSITRERDSLTIKWFQEKFGIKENNLLALKSKWLAEALPNTPAEYLELAEKVDKALVYREKYKGISEVSAKALCNYIFANESKPRVLAMFLMLCATIITLSVRENASISTVYEFYDGATASQLLLIFGLFPAFLLIGYIELKFFVLLLARTLERVLERSNSTDAFSKRRARIFINILMRLFSFEKPRIKL